MTSLTRAVSCGSTKLSTSRSSNLRRVSPLRAKDEEKSSFFEANRLANRGYTSEDSAGQENIFAVQPKKYIQGSSVDDTTGATANTVYGVGGAALALVVIAAGATALLVKSTQPEPTTFQGDFSGLSTLSEYKSKFIADTRQASAPSIVDSEA